MKRRTFLKTLAAGAALPLASGSGLRGAAPAPRTSLGVVQYSFSTSLRTRSSADFLEYGAALGAGGVQSELDSFDPDYLEKLRRRASELGMYLEVAVSLPQGDDASAFERQVTAAKRAGAQCLRSACLGGRRYENFNTLDQWKDFVAESHKRMVRAVPVLEKYDMTLGLENHKDWTADEMVALLERHASQHLGVCLDIGNNLALLDDPREVVEKLAPHTVTVHFKDMAVQEYAEGFRLSEVPLGQGILDLPWIIDRIRQARPRARLNLEMITRDPLKVPCLTEKYWATFAERNGRYLARTLALVRASPPREPLPGVSGMDAAARRQLEEENVEKCLVYAAEKLGLGVP